MPRSIRASWSKHRIRRRPPTSRGITYNPDTQESGCYGPSPRLNDKLKDRFQAEAAHIETKRTAAARSADDLDELKRQNDDLRRYSRHLENRLEIYATALNQLALEHAAISGRDADAAKVRTLPRRRPPLR